MSINFKALGGLLSFRYINKVEDLDLEDSRPQVERSLPKGRSS